MQSGWDREHTDSRDNLRLKAELIAEPAGDVGYSTMPIVNNIWNTSYVIEHVPAGKQQDKNERDGSPEVAGVDGGLQGAVSEFQDYEGDRHCAGGNGHFAPVKRADDVG